MLQTTAKGPAPSSPIGLSYITISIEIQSTCQKKAQLLNRNYLYWDHFSNLLLFMNPLLYRHFSHAQLAKGWGDLKKCYWLFFKVNPSSPRSKVKTPRGTKAKAHWHLGKQVVFFRFEVWDSKHSQKRQTCWTETTFIKFTALISWRQLKCYWLIFGSTHLRSLSVSKVKGKQCTPWGVKAQTHWELLGILVKKWHSLEIKCGIRTANLEYRTKCTPGTKCLKIHSNRSF